MINLHPCQTLATAKPADSLLPTTEDLEALRRQIERARMDLQAMEARAVKLEGELAYMGFRMLTG